MPTNMIKLPVQDYFSTFWQCWITAIPFYMHICISITTCTFWPWNMPSLKLIEFGRILKEQEWHWGYQLAQDKGSLKSQRILIFVCRNISNNSVTSRTSLYSMLAGLKSSGSLWVHHKREFMNHKWYRKGRHLFGK